MEPVTRLLLYLYALLADPSESRLVLVRGRRAFTVFHARVLPFIFNVFTQDLGGSEIDDHRRFIEFFYTFIGDIQVQYHAALRQLFKARLQVIPGEEETKVTIDVLLRRHALLVELDGTDGLAPTEDEIRILVRDNPFPTPAGEQRERLATALDNARESYDDLIAFNQVCIHPRINIRVWLAPDQVMGEFMAFLTHLSRAYFDTVHRTQDSRPAGDVAAGSLHIVRAVLDMRKAVIMSVFRHVPDLVPPQMARRLFAARRDEVRTGPHFPGKSTLYRNEVKELIAALRLRIT